jgi:4-diphosphocytidyl-2-C-methyl-D-erythritol kinase
VSAGARLLAPAKVNLRLRVLGRRPDGYHDIDTLFQAIDLTDDVIVTLAGSGIRLDVEGPDLGPLHENLAYRAAEGLSTALEFDGGIRIRLTKRIPAAAGLGGGSSDAAAVLRCLAALLDVDAADARLARVAAELGSDVPFFLSASTLAYGIGRGEVLEPLDALPGADLVVVSPPVHVGTAAAYRALAAERRSSGQSTSSTPGGPRQPPRNWEDVTRQAWNDFQAVIAEINPEITRAIEAIEDAGATFALMSGSGSSVFGLFGDRQGAERAAAESAEALAWPCRVVRTLEAFPEPQLR